MSENPTIENNLLDSHCKTVTETQKISYIAKNPKIQDVNRICLVLNIFQTRFYT